VVVEFVATVSGDPRGTVVTGAGRSRCHRIDARGRIKPTRAGNRKYCAGAYNEGARTDGQSGRRKSRNGSGWSRLIGRRGVREKWEITPTKLEIRQIAFGQKLPDLP
jgi:hypothetical protein